MNRHFTIIIGFFFLSILFALPGCKSCTGDKDTSGDVRCAGNVLANATSSSSSSGSDNDISDLIDNPKSIPIPKEITIADPNNSFKSFKIFKTEVTNEQYARFLKEKGARPTLSKDGEANDCHLDNNKTALCYLFTGKGTPAKDPQGDATQGGKAKILDNNYTINPDNASSHPVTYVSWYAAREFCKVKGWRLPSEKEWNIAAGTSKTYPWGGKEPTCAHANFASLAVTSGYCAGDTVSVSTKMASTDLAGLELTHMAGNVFEWTSTIMKDKDKDEDKEDRVTKGGAWDSGSEKLKNSARTLRVPTSTLPNLGFRCVK